MKLILKLSIVLICFSNLFAQSELNFEFDYARFKYDSTSVYLEFYYNLNSKGMAVTKEQNNSMVQAIVHVEMMNTQTDSFYINRDWKIQDVVIDNDSMGNQKNLSGVIGFIVPKGSYSILLKAWDANNSNFGKTIKDKIEIQPYLTDEASVSDIELATNIKNGDVDKNSLFYKNSLEVIPNPSMLYSNKSPAAFYYAELYNLVNKDTAAEYTLQKNIVTSSGKKVYNTSKNITVSHGSIVEVGVLNLSKYPTDSYMLILSLVNNQTKKAYLSSKRFYFHNPGVIDTTINNTVDVSVLGSSLAVMTNEECDRMFSECKYIATKNEIERFNSLDSLNAKRNFLALFWKSRDTDISTPQNEFQIDYMKRVEYTNEHFRFQNKEGYLSDRGRVYLLYGEPDQKDYYPNEANLKPYEVWFYNNIEGGVTFQFGDINGFGKYELLNSTKRGEIKDDNWMRRLSTQ